GPVITPRSRTPTRFAKCRKLWQLARREFPVAHGSRRLEDSTAIICFRLTRLHVCPPLRSLMRLRRTIPCTSRRDSPVLRRRTVWVRNSSKAKRLPFRLPLMGRLPWARRVRAARRWYCGRADGNDGAPLVGPVAARLPVGVDFIALPFGEPLLFRIASAYETATRHRRPPPDFGPVEAPATK